MVNLLAVPLMGVIAPLGFVGLASSLVMRGLGRIVAAPLIAGGVQDAIVAAFARVSAGSYRIPAAGMGGGAVFYEHSAGGEFSNDGSATKVDFTRCDTGDCVSGSR